MPPTNPPIPTPADIPRWLPEHLAALQSSIAAAVAEGVLSAAERLAAAPLKPILVDIKGVRALTGLSRATVYRMMAEGTFPKAIEGPKTAWRTKDLEKWAERLRTR